MTEDEMVGWRHRLNGHEFEQILGDGEGQGGLVCCSPWGHKESDTIQRLNHNKCINIQWMICIVITVICLNLTGYLESKNGT